MIVPMPIRRLPIGTGYRIYFGKDGETIGILLGGRTKKRQNEEGANGSGTQSSVEFDCRAAIHDKRIYHCSTINRYLLRKSYI